MGKEIFRHTCSACGMPSMTTGDTQQPSLKAWYEWGRGGGGKAGGGEI